MSENAKAELSRFVEKRFPNIFGDVHDDETVFRDSIVATLVRGKSAYWLGVREGVDRVELVRLRQCDREAKRLRDLEAPLA